MQCRAVNSDFLISQLIDLKFYRVATDRLTFDNMYKKYKFSVECLCKEVCLRITLII